MRRATPAPMGVNEGERDGSDTEASFEVASYRVGWDEQQMHGHVAGIRRTHKRAILPCGPRRLGSMPQALGCGAGFAPADPKHGRSIRGMGCAGPTVGRG